LKTHERFAIKMARAFPETHTEQQKAAAGPAAELKTAAQQHF
jgi:hypothetical protein